MGLFDKKDDTVASAGETPGVMPITNVFGIPTGCVVSGKITEGSFMVGDDVIVFHEDGTQTETNIKALEVGLGKMFDIVTEGQHVAIQLNGIDKSAVNPGSVLKKI